MAIDLQKLEQKFNALLDDPNFVTDFEQWLEARSVSQNSSKPNIIRRFSRCIKIRILKTKMYNLECDMMFFAITFKQYEAEKERMDAQLEYLSNGV
jgi:hypothetical protein